MRQSKQDGLLIFQFETLPAGQRHVVLGRQGGVSQPPFASLNLSSAVADAPQNLVTNRQRAYGLLGRDLGSLVHARLVHGAAVARVTSAHHGTIAAGVDALISNDPGCGLTMNYADCAPIILIDPARRAIGLGHAGWGGTVRNVAGAMVQTMVRAFGSVPADLVAGIGPCIGPCCYEVGEPVISAVKRAFSRPEEVLIPQENGSRPHFHIPAANRLQLAQAGVQQIEESGLCTACHTDLFFSHRAEKGKTGRFGVVVVLE